MIEQLHLFTATHTDTLRSMALMPGELCPAPCAACQTEPADEDLESLLADPANRHLDRPAEREKSR